MSRVRKSTKHGCLEDRKMSSRRQANVIWVLVQSIDITGPVSPP